MYTPGREFVQRIYIFKRTIHTSDKQQTHLIATHSTHFIIVAFIFYNYIYKEFVYYVGYRKFRITVYTCFSKNKE